MRVDREENILRRLGVKGESMDWEREWDVEGYWKHSAAMARRQLVLTNNLR